MTKKCAMKTNGAFFNVECKRFTTKNVNTLSLFYLAPLISKLIKNTVTQQVKNKNHLTFKTIINYHQKDKLLYQMLSSQNCMLLPVL